MLRRGLTLKLAAGETLVVIGPNGAGKTTLLRSPGDAAAARAPAGSRCWAPSCRGQPGARGAGGDLGHSAAALSRADRGSRTFEFNAKLHGIGGSAARTDRRAARGRPASSAAAASWSETSRPGCCQRAAVCRGALLHAPELLLLDEPRSHLDVAGAEVVEAMLAPRPGRSRVIVTHELERGLAGADRVLALHADGAVAYSGDADGLEAREARELYSGAVV